MAQALKVLFFTGDMGPGGSEAHLAQLMPRLDRRRIIPELMLGRAAIGYHRLTKVRDEGLHVHDLQWNGYRRGIPAVLARMGRVMGQVRPDIIHTYGYPCDIYAPLLALYHRDLKVVTTRRTDQPHAKRRLLYRLTNSMVDRVVCVSKSAERFAMDTEGLSKHKSVVIPNGVDSTVFRPLPRAPSPCKVLGTHARLRDVKGIDLLIEAFDRLQIQDLTLRIAGPTEDAWGENLRSTNEGRPRLSFLGDVVDTPGFLQSLDFFVLPSRSEGMSMALLEAMGTGLPIVATDVGSNSEVLADGQAGLIVRPEPQAIAAGIRTLVENPDKAAALGRAARARVEAHYSLAVMVERHMCFYETLVEGRPSH